VSSGELTRFSIAPPAELDELGRSAAELIEAMLRIDTDSPGVREALREARAAVAAAARSIDTHACREPGLRIHPDSQAPGVRGYYVQSPMIGPHHPLQMPIEHAHAEGVTRGRVRFGVAYEGPPGCVNGGFFAHFFDQLLGQHNANVKVPAMTGTLTVRYRRPVPLERELAFEARSEPLRGRTLRNQAVLSDAQGTLAEAEGVFVLPRTRIAQYVMDEG